MPNLPTEEVFTSPDRARADGRLRLTRPLVMPGTGGMVEGLAATLEAGRIVDVHADRGAEVVQAQPGTDEGARSLGEVALVDHDSRVRAAGVIFHDTLYDENAGSHGAWGQSFPFVLADWRERSPSNSSMPVSTVRLCTPTSLSVGRELTGWPYRRSDGHPPNKRRSLGVAGVNDVVLGSVPDGNAAVDRDRVAIDDGLVIEDCTVRQTQCDALAGLRAADLGQPRLVVYRRPVPI